MGASTAQKPATQLEHSEDARPRPSRQSSSVLAYSSADQFWSNCGLPPPKMAPPSGDATGESGPMRPFEGMDLVALQFSQTGRW